MCKKRAIIVSVILIVACCKPSEGVPPVVDKLHLEYENTMAGPMGRQTFNIRYVFSEKGRGLYEVDMAPTDGRRTKIDVVKEESGSIVDRFMRLPTGETLSYMEIPMWLPENKRDKGSRVRMDLEVFKIGKFADWEEVCMVGGGFMSGTWYYEKKTGFFVGGKISSFGAGWNVKLVDHNVWGL